MTAALALDTRPGRRNRALVGVGIAYVLVSATICAVAGPARPLVLLSDILTGWATLLRNTAAFAYRQTFGIDLRALAEDPAVLVMDIALTAAAALVNVLVVGGTYALIRDAGHSSRRSKILVGSGIALLIALTTTATLSTIEPTAFYGAIFQLPVD